MNHQGITKFIQLADESTQVPDLQKKSYSDYRLTPEEWTNLDLLRQVLKVLTMFHDLVPPSVANLINAAPRSCSTRVLLQMRPHCLPRLSNNGVLTYFTRSCREGFHFQDNSSCHRSWNFESHEVVSKA
jgi:hypothetical protein